MSSYDAASIALKVSGFCAVFCIEYWSSVMLIRSVMVVT